MNISRHTRSLAALAVGASLLVGCIGTTPQSPAAAPPSVAAVQASIRPARSATPEPARPHVDLGCADLALRNRTSAPDAPAPIPAVADPKIAPADTAAEATIAAAVIRLTDLRSYRFSLDVVGRDLALRRSTVDFALRGTLNRENGLAVDTLIGTRLREPDGSAVSNGSRIVLGTDYAWELDNVSEDLEPMPIAVASNIMAVLPEGVAERLVQPFGAGFERVGQGRHNGIAAVHYRATAAGRAAYVRALDFEGQLSADVWIASDGGHLSAFRLSGPTSSHDPLLIQIEIAHANHRDNRVDHPVNPVPDPVRPAQAPVDLRLKYRAVAVDNGMPPSDVMDQIGITLRTRLDVSHRPVSVTTSGRTVTVIVCNTSQPENDRRLVTAKGALSVVGLPRARFGTSASPGPEAIPAVGSRIDPALESIAPPARLGLSRAHVDPGTGRRGLAFMLSNEASELFRKYAETHRGEFVSVVLDGAVLASLPIDDRLARGHFVFTGDYTESEARNLASWLYRDPLPLPLELIDELEQPAS